MLASKGSEYEGFETQVNKRKQQQKKVLSQDQVRVTILLNLQIETEAAAQQILYDTFSAKGLDG